MKPGNAFNIFLAQVELRSDPAFAVTTTVDRLITTEAQEKSWENALSESGCALFGWASMVALTSKRFVEKLMLQKNKRGGVTSKSRGQGSGS
jgi:hypothetical protein